MIYKTLMLALMACYLSACQTLPQAPVCQLPGKPASVTVKPPEKTFMQRMDEILGYHAPTSTALQPTPTK